MEGSTFLLNFSWHFHSWLSVALVGHCSRWSKSRDAVALWRLITSLYRWTHTIYQIIKLHVDCDCVPNRNEAVVRCCHCWVDCYCICDNYFPPIFRANTYVLCLLYSCKTAIHLQEEHGHHNTVNNKLRAAWSDLPIKACTAIHSHIFAISYKMWLPSQFSSLEGMGSYLILLYFDRKLNLLASSYKKLGSQVLALS